MYQVTINNSKHEVILDDNSFSVNGKELNWDIITLDNGKFNIIYKNKSLNAELIEIGENKKEVTLKIEGRVYKVSVKDKFDQLLEKMGMNNLASSKLNDIKAPMPGLILSIDVKIGDEVKKGDKIMILEAMKMENILKAPGDGVVKSIPVNKGDSVEKNAILIQF